MEPHPKKDKKHSKSPKSTSPTTNNNQDFPTTTVPKASSPKSCVIILVQDTNTFPKKDQSRGDEPPKEDSPPPTATQTLTQQYETWKQNVVRVCGQAATAIHFFEVTEYGKLDPDFAFKKQIRDELASELNSRQPAAVIATHFSQYYLLGCVMQASQKSVFTLMADETVSKNAELRLLGADRWGIHMSSHVTGDIFRALLDVCSVPARLDRTGTLECPYCVSSKLTQYELWKHLQLFHINVKDKNESASCPMCKQYISHGGLYVHMHDAHAPAGVHTDERPDVKLFSFGLCVIRRKKDGKFLLCQEYANQGFWLPGGGVDACELPWEGAQRECLEEAGVKVKLTGVLRVEVGPSQRRGGSYCRMRYIFYGEPVDEDDCEPKTIPDFESAGACWVDYEEMRNFRLRGWEPQVWFKAVLDGCPIHPMSLFGLEGDTEVTKTADNFVKLVAGM